MSDATYEGRMPTIDDFCDLEPNEQKEMFPGFPCFLFTPEELKQAQSRQPMKCRCTQCQKVVHIDKHELQAKIVLAQSQSTNSLNKSNGGMKTSFIKSSMTFESQYQNTSKI